jgi:hypothetical protein
VSGERPDHGFNYIVPRPLIFGVSPTGGNVGTAVTITGQGFSQTVRVTFGGDSSTGSTAPPPTVSADGRRITTSVPTPPPSFTFNTEPCDGNGDGNPGGTRNIATAISVTVTDLGGTGCSVTLANAFTLNPQNTTCTGDTTEPVSFQCSDGADNDGDGFIDHSSVNPPGAPNGDPDPQCTSANDNTEGS